MISLGSYPLAYLVVLVADGSALVIALTVLGGIVRAVKAYRTPVAETLAPVS